MLIFSYTDAQRHKLPTGHPSQQTIGAHILRRCSRHRSPLVLPIVRPTRYRLDRMFDNILRGPVVEFRTQHSALRYASGGMLGQSEDFQIYSYKWYRSPSHQNSEISTTAAHSSGFGNSHRRMALGPWDWHPLY